MMIWHFEDRSSWTDEESDREEIWDNNDGDVFVSKDCEKSTSEKNQAGFSLSFLSQ